MKRVILFAVGFSLLLSSCGTYAGSGAMAGSQLGSVLGSAIGGISGGHRGSDLGTIVGMVGGAVVGGAIGNAADQKRQQDIEDYNRDKAHRVAARRQQNETYSQNDSGFDASNSGDDRIYDFNSSDYTGDYSAQQPTTMMPSSSSVDNVSDKLAYNPSLEIRNARFVDDNEDNSLNRNELCKLIFEVVNTGIEPVYDIVPTVVETTGNKHIWISPSIHIEKINPGRGIRYTAMIKADGKIKEGNARFCASVVQGNKAISKVVEFHIPTTK